MKTRTTTCRPRHAIPDLQTPPFSSRPRPHRSFLGFGISGFGIFLGFGILGFGISGALPAQLATIATGTTPPSTVTPITTGTGAGDEVVELSPFLVTGERTDGSYTAKDTTSGSRIKTDLRDTAASVSPFTDQFLKDIGATTLEDMLSYAANVEADTGDSGYDTEDQSVNTALPNTNAFRIRGLGMNTALDLVETSIPIDYYNIDRVEVSSGPNSILFGTGQAGGMATLTSKRANTNRNSLKASLETGTWTTDASTGWAYFRNTLDYNIVLMPKIMALRLMTLYQDGANDSWRGMQTTRDKRITPAITLRPWQNTTITTLYEAGNRRDPVTYRANAADRLRSWINAGSQLAPTFNPAAALRPPGTSVINTSRNEPYIVLVDNPANNPAPALYDARLTLISRGGFMTQNDNNDVGDARLPPDMSSYYYNVAGPHAVRNSRFDRYQLVIDQRIASTNLQLGYYHSKITATATGPNTYDIPLRADPNTLVSAVEWTTNVSNQGSNLLANPNAGDYYIEDYWSRRHGTASNDVLRLSAERTINSKKYGRHRIIANLEHSAQQNLSANYAEIVVDENGYAIVHPDYPVGKTAPFATPELGTSYANANNIPKNYGNSLWRRHYVTQNDWNTYRDADPNIPLSFDANGHHYTSHYAFDHADNPAHTKRQIDSLTLALQSYWLKDTLVTILGGRIDHVTLRREDYGGWLPTTGTLDPNTGAEYGILNDPNDPRLIANGGNLAWHEHYFDGHWTKAPVKTPFTYNIGAVWHLLDNLSLYFNTSSNRAAPADAAYYVAPTNRPGPNDKFGALANHSEPPQRQGRTKEAGLMYTLPGAKNLYLRLTYFDTSSIHDTAGQGSVNNNIRLSAAALADIYHAFNLVGLMTDPQYTAITKIGPAYTTALIDTYSKGIEAELTAQPIKNLTLRLTTSYTKRTTDHLFDDLMAFYNNNIPVWMGLADTYRGAAPYDMPNPADGTLYDYIINKLYGSAGIRDNLNTLAQRQGIVGGARPLKFTLTTRYAINTGPLKGAALGLGIRYQDQVRVPPAKLVLSQTDPVSGNDHPLDLRFNPNIYTDQSIMQKGNSLLFYDPFISYKRKLFKGRATMTLQLNIKNLFNNDVLTYAQYRSTSNPGNEDKDTPYVRRVYLNPPRQIRLTATFDF